MANIVAALTGLASDGSSWVGGVAPTTNDTITIPSGVTITITENTPVFGSNSSAMGHGIQVLSGGELVVGATLNVNGYDTSLNKAIQIDAGGVLRRSTGGSIIVTPASSWQTTINNDGDFIWDGGVIESGETWTFVPRNKTLTSTSPTLSRYASDGARIWSICAGQGVAGTTAGPISNVVGNAVGTPLDNSFIPTSITGGSLTPSNVFQTKVSSMDELTFVGAYFVDCPNGMVYYYENESKLRLSMTYIVSTHQWLGFGIISARNGESKFLLQNATLRRIGGYWGSHSSEYTQQGLYIRYHTNGVVNPAYEGYVRNCTFEYCICPLKAYSGTNTEANPLDLTGNTFKYTAPQDGVWGSANIIFGYNTWVDCSDCVFNNMGRLSHTVRGVTNLIMRRMTGRVCCDSVVPRSGVKGCIVEDCVLEDTGSWDDAGGFQAQGEEGYINVYHNNKMYYGHRCGRIGPHMTIDGNEFVQYNHHGFVAPVGNGYYTGIRIKNNIIRDAARVGDMGGGWTLGYNYTHWLDDVEISNNTFKDGNRSISFNDREGTVVLGTRLKIWNNNLTGAWNGIQQPENDAANQSAKHILRLDYNNEFDMEVAGNIVQGTAISNGTEYNFDNSKNIKGIALYNPSVINGSLRDLTLIVSGTPGVDLSMLLSWGAGDALELVSAQGTATGGTGATSHSSPGTIIDSTKAWVSDEIRLHQGAIVSGTGSGQKFMIRTNTANTLTVMPNVVAGTFTAPSTDSVYILLKSEVTLIDGSNTIQAGVYIPEIDLTNGTYVDSGITISSNSLVVDPEYVSTFDLTPRNIALKGTAFGGGDIGALNVYNNPVVVKALIRAVEKNVLPVVAVSSSSITTNSQLVVKF